jgi:diguanylate cyclase (GGDEF)-like protein
MARALRSLALVGDARVPFRDLIFLSSGEGPTQRIRNAQVDGLVGLMPLTNFVNLFNACLLAAALRGEVPGLELAVWVGAIGVLAITRALHAHAHTKGKAQRASVPAVLLGLIVLALLWAVPGIAWLDRVGQNEKILIMLVTTGMIGGASVSLASLPLASFTYIFSLSCVMVKADLALGLPALAAMSVAYAATLFWTSLLYGRQFITHLRTRMELEEQGELIGLLREFEASGSDWLWELDGDLNLVYMSREMADASARSAGGVRGITAPDILDPTGRIREVSVSMRAVFDHFRNATPFRDLAVPTMDGRWWSLSAKPMWGGPGQCIGWRGVGSDITDVRMSGSNGVRAARRDPLTGLGNRLLVREHLEEALLRPSRGRSALMLVDLDRFKLVNDTLGHAVGDQLLKEVAQRLQRAVGSHGFVGRLGGDEFAVILANIVGEDALAQLAGRLIADVSAVYMVAGVELRIGATVGIACAPVDGASEDELMRAADLALYRGKEEGRGEHKFFEGWMRELADSNRELELDLRNALDSGSLTLAYQPIVSAACGDILAHEALLRWNHPVRGAIPPDDFVPLLEDAGLINRIGSWVIREACAQAAHWPDGHRIAVNVSATQLTGPQLNATVVAALAEAGLAPDRLELEVTESIFLGDDQATLNSLADLRKLGVRMVLDDFGKGYSSFGYLCRAGFSKIKIDQSFVQGAAAGEPEHLAIVEAMMALARRLQIETTAEGVETLQQEQVMRALGCDQLQGFRFGRPIPADSVMIRYEQQFKRSA